MSADYDLYAMTPLGVVCFPIRPTTLNVVDALVHESIRFEDEWGETFPGNAADKPPIPVTQMTENFCRLTERLRAPTIFHVRRLIHHLARLGRLFGDQCTAAIYETNTAMDDEAIRQAWDKQERRKARLRHITVVQPMIDEGRDIIAAWRQQRHFTPA